MSNDSSESQLPPRESGYKGLAYARVPWSPWAGVLYAVAVFFTAQVLAGLFVVFYPHLRGWGAARTEQWFETTVGQFWFVLIAEILTFGAVWWFVRWRRSSLRALGWRRVRWTDGVFALAGFAVYFVGYVVLLTVAARLFPSLNVDQKQELGFQNAAGGLAIVLTFLSLVVMPPLVEETVFRGLVFTGIRNKLKPLWAALLTSVLFASAHLQFGSGKPLLWVAALDTFTLSLVLCYLRHKTDSLWPGILLHALKNGIAFITLFVLHVR